MHAEIFYRVAIWFKKQGISFDSAKFISLLDENYEALIPLEAFHAEGQLESLLDHYDYDLKKGDLETFFSKFQDLFVFTSGSEVVEEFVEAHEISERAARFLDKGKIIDDFLCGGGFLIGTVYCSYDSYR